jgi:hypothetical protein
LEAHEQLSVAAAMSYFFLLSFLKLQNQVYLEAVIDFYWTSATATTI